MVELVRSGRSVAREFEPSGQTIRNWVRQADLDEGRGSDGLTTEARLELLRLKRENKRLRVERDILRRAAAWFGDAYNNTMCESYLRDAGVRTDRPGALPDRSRCAPRSLRLHRRLLQHPPSPPVGARATHGPCVLSPPLRGDNIVYFRHHQLQRSTVRESGARPEFRAPATAQYTILAVTLSSEQTGRYTLRVERSAGGAEGDADFSGTGRWER